MGKAIQNSATKLSRVTPSSKPRRKVIPTNLKSKVVKHPKPAPRGSAAALLKHATGWAGNDLDDLLHELYATRGKARF